MTDTIYNKDLGMNEYLERCEKNIQSYEDYKKRVEETGVVDINCQEDLINEKSRLIEIDINKSGGIDAYLKKKHGLT